MIRIDPRRREVREQVMTGRQPFALDLTGRRDVWVTLINGNGVQRIRFDP